jgi:cytidine deaminase
VILKLEEKLLPSSWNHNEVVKLKNRRNLFFNMLPEKQTGNNPGAKSTQEGSKGKVLLPREVVNQLKKAARRAAENSYSPYSNFPVGAAVLTKTGKIYVGTNVENSSYGLTLCAERMAIACAVSAGERAIKALAVYTPSDEPIPPCGACLAVIAEFAEGGVSILMFTDGKESWSNLAQLLPKRFKLKPKETS